MVKADRESVGVLSPTVGERDAEGCRGGYNSRRMSGQASGSGLTKARSSIPSKNGWLRIEV